jgi:hypothetical protein
MLLVVFFYAVRPVFSKQISIDKKNAPQKDL